MITAFFNAAVLIWGAVLLYIYITASEPKAALIAGRISALVSVLSLAGAALTSVLLWINASASFDKAASAVAYSDLLLLIKVCFAAALFCIAVSLISFFASRSAGSAVLRLCFVPLWSMLMILVSSIMSEISSSTAADAAVAAGIFLSLTVFFVPSVDMRRLAKQLEKDRTLLAQRKAKAALRRKKREAAKNASALRKKLRKGGKK